MTCNSPNPDTHEQALLRYRKTLVLVALVSILCGIVIGVYAIAPLRETAVPATLAPPVLRTAVPLATQPISTSTITADATQSSDRNVIVEMTPEDISLLNINTATYEQLLALPGIGETRAQGIIAYREQHGQFMSIQDIIEVDGIGEGTLEKIAPYITVGGTEG